VLEEMEMDNVCNSYDCFYKEIDLYRNTGVFTLPGVDEQRPYLLYGDTVRLRFPPAQPVAMEHYELCAYVLRVKATESEVTISLPAPSPNGDPFPLPPKCHMRFVWNRVRFRRAHNVLRKALTSPADFYGIIFPDKSMLPTSPGKEEEYKLGDASLDPRLSSEQKSCVCAVLNARNTSGRVPLLLLGSAGSGKTETIVETVVQAVNKWSSPVNVLVCAPSNGAADILALRLIGRVKVSFWSLFDSANGLF
jgi:helicase MOV-10